MNIPKIDYFKLVVSILVCQLAGVIGSAFTVSSVSTWYATLTKPFFTPPGWLFGPVWITLYLLMGIALYLVWKKGSRATSLFAVQLALNALWPILFFGLRSPLLALVEIIALLTALVFTTTHFLKISRPAGYLLMPYLAWVAFATVLNAAIVYLN